MPLTDGLKINLKDTKALKIIARSIYKELNDYGFKSHHIVSLSNELLGLVTEDMELDTSQPKPQATRNSWQQGAPPLT